MSGVNELVYSRSGNGILIHNYGGDNMINNKQTAIITMIALVAYALVGTKTASADWTIVNGKLIYEKGLVLSEEKDQTDDFTSDIDENDIFQDGNVRLVNEQNREIQKKVEENQKEMTKKQEEITREAEQKKKEQIMEIKAKRLDLGAEVKFENKDGKMKIETKNRAGKVEDLGEQDDFVIESEVRDEENLHIKKSENKGEMELKKGRFVARTNFPISVNPETNELSVTTPTGTKVVTVLPDQAMKNLMEKRIVDTITQDSAGISTTNLTEVEGEPVYNIAGVRNQKLFGVLMVNIPTTAVVSASDGTILETKQVLWSRVLDFVSF